MRRGMRDEAGFRATDSCCGAIISSIRSSPSRIVRGKFLCFLFVRRLIVCPGTEGRHRGGPFGRERTLASPSSMIGISPAAARSRFKCGWRRVVTLSWQSRFYCTPSASCSINASMFSPAGFRRDDSSSGLFSSGSSQQSMSASERMTGIRS